MPEPWAPVYTEYKKIIEQLDVNENTVLIGHSCGTAFLVRWLGEAKLKVKKLILVAPWKIPWTLDADDCGPYCDQLAKFNKKIKEFCDFEIDPKIKERVDEIIVFTADNEEEDGKKSAQIFHQALGGRLIELAGRKHYIMKQMGTEEFPELIEAVLE